MIDGGIKVCYVQKWNSLVVRDGDNFHIFVLGVYQRQILNVTSPMDRRDAFSSEVAEETKGQEVRMEVDNIELPKPENVISYVVGNSNKSVN